MNNQEYECGELITDWSVLYQGDFVYDDDDDYFLEFLTYDKKRQLVIFRYCTNSSFFEIGINTCKLYRAIPKKKKVVKYLYEFINVDGKRYTSDSFYIDDDDFKKNNCPITLFHCLDWTAQPFDE